MSEQSLYLVVASGVVTCVLTVVGWGIRAALQRINRMDAKVDATFSEIITRMDANRAELHEFLKEYVRRETCRAHRDAIGRQIADLRSMVKFGRRVGDRVLSDVIQHFNEVVEDEVASACNHDFQSRRADDQAESETSDEEDGGGDAAAEINQHRRKNERVHGGEAE